jgi:hypothetical protein
MSWAVVRPGSLSIASLSAHWAAFDFLALVSAILIGTCVDIGFKSQWWETPFL